MACSLPLQDEPVGQTRVGPVISTSLDYTAINHNSPAAPALVVLVDDNPGDVFLFGNALTEIASNAQILSFSSGAEAMVFLEDGPIPDLIILDFRLPDVTGLELATRLKADARLREVRTVLVSGLVSPDDQKAAAEKGLTCLRKGSSLQTWTDLAAQVHDWTMSRLVKAAASAA